MVVNVNVKVNGGSKAGLGRLFENGTNKGTGFGPWIFATTNNGVYDATMNTPLDMGNISTSGNIYTNSYKFFNINTYNYKYSHTYTYSYSD